jgi:hypothetical protein
VADSSSAVLAVRTAPTWVDEKPEAIRKVTIWPENERTVRYSIARAIEGRKAGWWV